MGPRKRVFVLGVVSKKTHPVETGRLFIKKWPITTKKIEFNIIAELAKAGS